MTSGNVVFGVVRLQALLGNFNYGKRGILDLTHTRLYTFKSLERLFDQCGFHVEQLAGIPAPFPKALGDNRMSRALVWLNDLPDPRVQGAVRLPNLSRGDAQAVGRRPAGPVDRDRAGEGRHPHLGGEIAARLDLHPWRDSTPAHPLRRSGGRSSRRSCWPCCRSCCSRPSPSCGGCSPRSTCRRYLYPYHVVPARMLAAGHLPLWNPYVFSGIPLLGDGQTAMFYPPNWLFFLLPGETALNLVVLLQFSIAGVGMFAFARTLGLWRLPAFVAAAAYMFCGFMSARIVHLSIMSGAALVPAILACVDRLLDPRCAHRGRWCAATAVALGCQAAAGHPQVPIYTALAVGLYTIVRAVERRTGGDAWRRVSAAAMLVGAAYVLGYGLAAVQLVPWIECARLSTRAAGATYKFVFGTSTAGADWLLFLFPYLLGAHGASPFAAGPFPIKEAVRVWEHSAYVGILPLALAAAGLGHLGELTLRARPAPRIAEAQSAAVLRRRWFSMVFLTLLLGTGLLMAAGWHTPFGRVLYLLPVLGKLRAVERALVLAAFALAACAAFGLQRILEGRGRRAWLLIPAALVPAAPVLFVVHAYLRPSAPLLGVPAQDLARLSLQLPHAWLPLVLAAASALLLAWCSRAPAGRLARGLVVALVVFDLGVYVTAFTPTTMRRLYRVRPQVTTAWQSDWAPFRKATVLVESRETSVQSEQHTLAMSWAMVHGVEDVNGFNSLQPRRYTDYVFGTRG